MKRIAITLISSLMVLVALSDEPINIVFIGNSITYGANLSDPTNTAPPVKTAKLVAQKTGRKVNYKNCGLSGSTTLNWLPGTSLYSRAESAAQEFQKEGGLLFFSMMLGTNDSAESGCTGSPVSPEDYMKNLKVIIQTLMAKFPEARFIVNYPLWYSPNTHNGAVYKEKGLARLQTYYPKITELVEIFQKSPKKQVWAGNIGVFEFFENQTGYFVAENGNSGVFYLHPNTTGGTKLAQFWTNSIVEHLEPLETSITDADQALVDSARLAVAGSFTVNSKSVKSAFKLLKKAQESDPATCQIFTNAVQGEKSSLDKLIDLKNDTYFETSSTGDTLVATPHFLEVDLKNDTVHQVLFTMQRRLDSGVTDVTNWQPNNMDVWGSNDREEWVRLNGLRDGFPTVNQKTMYVSPLLQFSKPYRYLRFVVHSTTGLEISKGGNICFNMAEFQIYAVNVIYAKSSYYTFNGMQDACDALTALCDAYQQKFSVGNPLTEEERAELKANLLKVETLQQDYATHIVAVTPNHPEEVYNLKGQKVPDNPTTGIYIQGNKKVVIP